MSSPQQQKTVVVIIAIIVLVLVGYGIVHAMCVSRKKKTMMLGACGGFTAAPQQKISQVARDWGTLTVQDLIQKYPVGTILYNDLSQTMKDQINAAIPYVDNSDLEVTLPTNFDARTKFLNTSSSKAQFPSLINVSSNQGQCGDCFLVASCDAISDRMRVYQSFPEFLQPITYAPPGTGDSYQFLNGLSCYAFLYNSTNASKAPSVTNSSGCGGGIPALVFQYINTYGLPNLVCAPPVCDPTKTCPKQDYSKCQLYKALVVHRSFLDDDDYDTKLYNVSKSIFVFGSVCVTLQIYQSFYDFFTGTKNADAIYSESVMNSYPGDTLVGGHAVTAIGFGVGPDPKNSTSQIPYLLIRNSWGLDWNGSGTFKIQTTICQILGESWDAHMSTSTNPNLPPFDPTRT